MRNILKSGHKQTEKDRDIATMSVGCHQHQYIACRPKYSHAVHHKGITYLELLESCTFMYILYSLDTLDLQVLNLILTKPRIFLLSPFKDASKCLLSSGRDSKPHKPVHLQPIFRQLWWSILVSINLEWQRLLCSFIPTKVFLTLSMSSPWSRLRKQRRRWMKQNCWFSSSQTSSGNILPQLEFSSQSRVSQFRSSLESFLSQSCTRSKV